MSFADFLDIWFERTKLDARNNTLELREKNIRLHLKPALGSYRLTSLSPQIIDGFVRQKRQDGYSYETVDRMLSNIKVALDYAIWPMELLKANPAQLIKVPGKNFAELSRRRPRRRIENDELVQLFDHFPFGNTYHMPLALGLYFGTRIGETLGLSWADCDLDARELHIRLQIQRLSMRGHHSLHYLCDLKTESSHRTLAFGSGPTSWPTERTTSTTTSSPPRTTRAARSRRSSPSRSATRHPALASTSSARSPMASTSSLARSPTSASASARWASATSTSTACDTLT